MRFYNGPKKEGKDGRVRWAFMSSFDIPCEDGRLYLRRLRIVQTPWFSVLLHEIHEPDSDRHMHDHPFNFFTLILKGGYEEVVAETLHSNRPKFNVWHRGTFHAMRTHQIHKITHLHQHPTWTLVLTGARTREWGFMTEQGWVHWEEYEGAV